MGPTGRKAAERERKQSLYQAAVREHITTADPGAVTQWQRYLAEYAAGDNDARAGALRCFVPEFAPEFCEHDGNGKRKGADLAGPMLTALEELLDAAESHGRRTDDGCKDESGD
jgi:hypothetical protein